MENPAELPFEYIRYSRSLHGRSRLGKVLPFRGYGNTALETQEKGSVVEKPIPQEGKCKASETDAVFLNSRADLQKGKRADTDREASDLARKADPALGVLHR